MHDRLAGIECTFANDARLIAGSAAVVAHIARRAGFHERVQGDLATAAISACCEIFLSARALGHSAPIVRLSASHFPDRVEVFLEILKGGRRAPRRGAGLLQKAASQLTENIRKSFEGIPVDRVECDAPDGRPVVTLTKFRGGRRPAS